MKKFYFILWRDNNDEKNISGALEPFHSSKDLLKMVPEASNFAELSFIDVVNIDSTNIDPSIWTKLPK